jgi:hypothetical protein
MFSFEDVKMPRGVLGTISATVGVLIAAWVVILYKYQENFRHTYSTGFRNALRTPVGKCSFSRIASLRVWRFSSRRSIILY